MKLVTHTQWCHNNRNYEKVLLMSMFVHFSQHCLNVSLVESWSVDIVRWWLTAIAKSGQKAKSNLYLSRKIVPVRNNSNLYSIDVRVRWLRVVCLFREFAILFLSRSFCVHFYLINLTKLFVHKNRPLWLCTSQDTNRSIWSEKN